MGAELLRVRARGVGERLGRDYGQQARGLIARTIDAYETLFRWSGWSWEDARQFAIDRTAGLENVSPRRVAELRGIAAGADRHESDILALNLRTEILQAATGGLARQECTALGVRRTATRDGRAYLAQNWDYAEAVSGTVVALEVESPDCPFFVTFVEAGMLAKTGMNQHSIGVATNALSSQGSPGNDGLPFHFVLRDILESRTLSDALGAITARRRASSANYMIGDRNGVLLDVETAPGDHRRVSILPPEGRVVCHANHFVREPQEVHDLAAISWMDSWVRLQRMHDLAGECERPISPEDVAVALRDHANYPDSVCRHPDPEKTAMERSTTHFSVIYDLMDRQIRFALGRPCETEYCSFEVEWPT